MIKETKYLLVYDTSVTLLDENCEHLGFPIGTTFEQMREYGKPSNGVIKQKEGKDIWVLPFYVDDKICFEDNPTVYEVLTLQEYKNVTFDIIEDYV